MDKSTTMNAILRVYAEAMVDTQRYADGLSSSYSLVDDTKESFNREAAVNQALDQFKEMLEQNGTLDPTTGEPVDAWQARVKRVLAGA